MKKMLFLSILFIMVAVPAFAKEAESSPVSVEKLAYYSAIGVIIVLAMAGAVVGGAIAQGNVISGAVKSIAKNAVAGGKITLTAVVGMAFIESLVIYALVVALILLFGIPFKI